MSETNPRSPHLIVLANEPRMMRDMLARALDGTPGLIVVDHCAALENLSDLFQQVQLDWLVVTLNTDGEIALDAQIYLRRTPTLSVVALSPDGARAEVLLKDAAQVVLSFSLIEITLTALVSILRYKWDDHQLPPVLTTLRAFQVGSHRHSIYRPHCRATKS